MRLFLSSQDLGNYAHVAVEMAGDNKKAIFIKNAQDDLPAHERNFSTPLKKEMFENAGFSFEEIDLRDYFGKTDELRKKIVEAGSFWSSGGNTFILRRAMKASGFDKVLLELLNADKIMYGGWSAGACVASKSLDGIQFGDRPSPSAVPSEYPNNVHETIWEGLGVIDFMPIPHCNMEWFKTQAVETKKYMKKHQIEYKKLNDGQVFIVNGDKQELLV